MALVTNPKFDPKISGREVTAQPVTSQAGQTHRKWERITVVTSVTRILNNGASFEKAWRIYEQQLVLGKDQKPFAIIKWKHTIAEIRIIDAYAPSPSD